MKGLFRSSSVRFDLVKFCPHEAGIPNFHLRANVQVTVYLFDIPVGLLPRVFGTDQDSDYNKRLKTGSDPELRESCHKSAVCGVFVLRAVIDERTS